MCYSIIEKWRSDFDKFVDSQGDDSLTNSEVIKRGLELEEKFKAFELEHPYCD